jgi:ribonuclease P protein component
MKKTKMLKKNYEFKNVLSKGKYYSGKYIEAFIRENRKKEEINYLGIAIGVKIAKANKRNYIKRLIRENYKNCEDLLETGYSIVFLWKKKKDTQNANFENIKEDMNQIFDKAHLFKENK